MFYTNTRSPSSQVLASRGSIGRRYPRFTSRITAYPAPASAAVATPMMLDVTHVRQALQHTAAMGAFSPYFAVA
jgi:hypothetical protein